MPYRPNTPRQVEARARKLEAMRRGKDAARLARPAPGRMPDLPELRRELIVIDYDTGAPVRHTVQLFRCGRVDQYRAVADGAAWKDRIGWSRVVAAVRKAYQRVPSPRSDFWRCG